MDRGGAETLLMNVYRNIDREKLQFDFLVHSNNKGNYEDEIISLGGKIHRIQSLGVLGPIKYIRELLKVISQDNYIAVHSHTDYQSGFPTLAAKLSGIKKRICHSHSSSWPKGKSLKEMITLNVLKLIIKISATNYCGCSLEAAKFLFGKTSKVKILKNGIDLSQFTTPDENMKDILIEEFQFPEEIKIIGHIGRFSESKNHLFILDVLKTVLVAEKNFVALLIGDGPLKEEIERKADKLGILNNIRLLGVREDIPRLMGAFDVFLFPSKFEGFGIVTVEAQSLGIPCVISDTVPKTTDMGLGLVSYLNLNESLNVWSSEITKALSLERPSKRKIFENISSRGYNIQDNVDDWLRLYGFN